MKTPCLYFETLSGEAELRNSAFVTGGIIILSTCLGLLLPSQSTAADKKAFGELGLGFALVNYGESGEKSFGAALSLAFMGSHFGVEGDAFHPGIFRSTSLAGSIVLSTGTFAQASGFVQVGVGTNLRAGFLVPAGIGVRFKVGQNFFLSARLLWWVVYEGGVSFDFGFRYRFPSR